MFPAGQSAGLKCSVTPSGAAGQTFINFVHPTTASHAGRNGATDESWQLLDFVNRYLCHDGSIGGLSWRANYVAAETNHYAFGA